MGKKTPKQNSKAKAPRKAGLNKAHSARNRQDAHLPEFTTQQQGPLIMFKFTSAKAQHQALSRVEAFYESGAEAAKYLSLEEAGERRLCPNYQAFNMPVGAVGDWMRAMRESEAVGARGVETNAHGWWRPLTNVSESRLLDRLSQAGCLGRHTTSVGEAPSYLISVCDRSSAPHEASHALYFLHEGYRREVQRVWDRLSSKCRSIVQHDMKMRGYGRHVWVDEFQAYVGEDDAEFGSKAKEECAEVKRLLAKAQRTAWGELNLDVGAFTSQ